MARAAPADRPWIGGRTATLVILIASVVGLMLLFGRPPHDDEAYHLSQIDFLLEGQSAGALPMWPGYHWIVGHAPDLLGGSRLSHFRAVSLGLGLLSVLAFYGCARQLHGRRAAGVTLQYFFLPVFSRLFFLVFTDPTALAGALGCLYFSLRGWPMLAALLGTGALLIRQTNITWITLVFLLAYVDRHGWRLSRQAIADHLRSYWSFAVPLGLFAWFVGQNRGLVLGTSQAATTQVLTGQAPIHAGNVVFVPMLVTLCWLPLVLGKLWQQRHLPRSRRETILTAAVLGTFVLMNLLFYRVTHPWNHDPWYLGNRLILFTTSGTLGRFAGLGLMGLGLLFLLRSHLVRPSMALLYPLGIASLVPLWLISARYEAPLLVYLLLFLRPADARWERLGVCWAAALSVVAFYGLMTDLFAI